MDATNISYDDACFDFVFDKGTFDCLLSSPFDLEKKVYLMLEVKKKKIRKLQAKFF